MKRHIAIIAEVLFIALLSYYYIGIFGGTWNSFVVILLFLVPLLLANITWIKRLYRKQHQRVYMLAKPLLFWMVIIISILIPALIMGDWTGLALLVLDVFFLFVVLLSIPFYWIISKPIQIKTSEED